MKRIIIFCLFFLVANTAAHCEESNYPSQSEIQASSQKLMSNPENIAAILSLASDPQIQTILNDPQIQQDVQSGNIQALLGNEKFMAIVNDPSMQNKLKKLK